MWNNTDYQTGPSFVVDNVKPAFFRKHYENARSDRPQIAEATSPFDPAASRGTLYFEGSDGINHWGYAIRPDGELVYVFSTARGMGDRIVSDAIAKGAVYLDCFDGYLVNLYSRHGFRVVKRVANWTPGEPDVVYMSLPGHADKHGVRNCNAFGRGCGGHYDDETQICVTCGALAS